jgi:glycosyltransferase involved in cell wall biosynthesis
MIKISNNSPEVSIVMTVYNTDGYKIRRAIDSILKQDYQKYEVIIVDDGSDPDPGAMILGYIAAHCHKFMYFKHANHGQSISLNRGIANCMGRYIGLIDSDDEYKPNHITECLKQMESGADLISSITETIVNSEDDFYIPDKDDALVDVHIDDCILSGTFFGRREVFLDFGFNSYISYGLDPDLFFRAAGKYITRKVDLRTYIYYRDSPDSVVSLVKKNRISLG